MNRLNLVSKFSEYSEVFHVGFKGKGRVEVVVSEPMAWRILEALRIYALVEEALKEFGKRIKSW